LRKQERGRMDPAIVMKEKYPLWCRPLRVRRTALILLVAAASSFASTSAPPELADSTEIEVVLSYQITPNKKSLSGSKGAADQQIKLTVNLPQTIKGRQEVTKIAYDPMPSRIFTKNGNKYAEYDIPVPKEKTVIKIRIEAKAFRFDLATAMKKKNRDSLITPYLTPFLRHERMIEKNAPAIKKISRAIEGSRELEIVENIYKYVIRNLTIDASRSKGVGAAKTARTKKGKCIDYCDLFVALCRAKNIPARVVAGYRTHFNISPKHSWVEVYLKEYGWVPFDISVSNEIPQELLDRRFYNLGARYLSFTNLRNDPVLHNNYFYCYPIWDMNLRKVIMPILEKIEFEKPLKQKHDSQELERARKTDKFKQKTAE